LFIPSELTWQDKGLVVRQQTRFPEEEATHLTITATRPTRLALKVRAPSWATAGVTITVNGQPVAQLNGQPAAQVNGQPVAQGFSPADAAPKSRATYVTVDREWKTGDRVDVKLPMSLHTEAMPDNPR